MSVKIIETTTTQPQGMMQKTQDLYRVVEVDDADGVNQPQTTLPVCDWKPVPPAGIPTS